MSTQRNAAVYSAAIGLLVTIACGIWVVVVLPNIAGTFHEFKTQLPFPTRVLLAVVNLPEIWPPSSWASEFSLPSQPSWCREGVKDEIALRVRSSPPGR